VPLSLNYVKEPPMGRAKSALLTTMALGDALHRRLACKRG
jgi:hypothetical protein